jgi:hypothetical protein
MNAIVSCRDHDHSKRDIYDLCETNEGGEVRIDFSSLIFSSNNNISIQTALQVYCQAYKQAPIGQAHGLLRKARRLDSILNIRSSDAQQPIQPVVPAGPEPSCCRCQSQFSPAFYPAADTGYAANGPSESPLWMCHKCHFEAAEANGARSMGMMVS